MTIRGCRQHNIIFAVDAATRQELVASSFEDARWRYTTLPITTEAEVLAVFDGYCQRWNIEMYFMTLKSGLKIEDMKCKTLLRYLNASAMPAVMVRRVEYLKKAARVETYFSAQK